MAKLSKMIRKRLMGALVSGGAAWAAGIAADRLLHAGLRKTGKERARTPLGRSAATAGLAGAVEVLAARGVALAWKAATGKRPGKG
ncbi:MAG TPA: hypothetical protein VE913_16190 [Longimicrobium sp.]|nr:hypothetical protein [Longimicrobium sp.]